MTLADSGKWDRYGSAPGADSVQRTGTKTGTGLKERDRTRSKVRARTHWRRSTSTPCCTMTSMGECAPACQRAIAAESMDGRQEQSARGGDCRITSMRCVSARIMALPSDPKRRPTRQVLIDAMLSIGAGSILSWAGAHNVAVLPSQA
jgi:hypothetical protein